MQVTFTGVEKVRCIKPKKIDKPRHGQKANINLTFHVTNAIKADLDKFREAGVFEAFPNKKGDGYINIRYKREILRSSLGELYINGKKFTPEAKTEPGSINSKTQIIMDFIRENILSSGKYREKTKKVAKLMTDIYEKWLEKVPKKQTSPARLTNDKYKPYEDMLIGNDLVTKGTLPNYRIGNGKPNYFHE